MAKRRVDGLTFKPGPTRSGAFPTSPPVGGEIVGVDVVSVFISKYWLLMLLLLIPLAYALYKKRSALPKWFLRLFYLLKGL
ncbi:MAG: hypothetical protein ACE14S_12675 [Candidatus Bathyarchaeia archaeon]